MENLELILSDQRAELSEIDLSNYITRQESEQINIRSTLAQIVIGVRRSGKSTLCQQVVMKQSEAFGYVNFDDDRLINFSSADFDELLKALYHINGNFNILFLDEVQNIKGWELFVNRMLRQKMNVILTGSNANLLSQELATHLTGRYHQIELYTYSFSEYCRILKVDTDSYTTKAIALREKALNDYLLGGGFPELFKISENEHTSYINSLFDAIIEKDICKRYKIRHPQILKSIALQILDEFAQEQSYTGIMEKNRLNSVNTTKKYIQYLSNAYLLCTIPRFSLKSRIRRTVCKYYAIDCAFITMHEGALQTESFGLRLENAVAIHLLRKTRQKFSQLYYLKDDRNYEIDFVIVSGNRISEMVQVTYDFREPSTKLYNRELVNLAKAAKQFNCDNLTLVMMYGKTGDIIIEGKTIHCVSATRYLLAD